MSVPDMKRFTTSAQKTLTLPKTVIMERLQQAFSADELLYEPKGSAHLLQAACSDGSKLVIAAFDKPGGKTLLMIDHQNIPGDKERSVVQQGLRDKLDQLFDLQHTISHADLGVEPQQVGNELGPAFR